MQIETFKEGISLYNAQNTSKKVLKDNFVIRLREYKKLWAEIKKSSMKNPEQHYIIQGVRGSGKTTLLGRLAIAVEESPMLSPWLIPVVLKEEEYGISSLFTLWERVAEELEHCSTEAGTFTGLLDDLEALEETDAKAAMNLLNARLKKEQKKIILFIDNLAELFNHFTGKEEAMLREVLMRNSNIRVIGGSSISLEAFYDHKAPFYQFFNIITLKALSKLETGDLLKQLGQYSGEDELNKVERILEQEPQKVESIRRLTGGIPRTIVILFNILLDGPKGSTYKILEETIDQTTPLYKHRMDDLSKQQKPIINAIALHWDAISTKEIAEKTRLESKHVSAQLRQLEKQWLIEKIPTNTKNNLYALQERFFNIWYLMRYGRRKDRKKVIWLTQFFELWCSGDELKQRAKGFAEQLSMKSHPAAALTYANAMICSEKLDGVERQWLHKKTSEFLQTSGNSSLVNELISVDSAELSDNKSSDEMEKVMASYVSEKNSDKRNSILQKLEMFANSNREWNTLGIMFSEQKEWDKAEEYYLKAIEHEEYGAYLNLGLIAMIQEQLDKANAYYLNAIKHGEFKAYIDLGNINVIQNKLAKAEGYYLKATEHGQLNAFRMLGDLNVIQEKWTEAEAYYLKAIKRGQPEVYRDLGDAYLAQGKLDKAEVHYIEAIEHRQFDAYLNLGQVYLIQNQLDKAEVNFLKVIEHGQFDAYLGLGHIYFLQKQCAKAEVNYLKAIEHKVDGACNGLAWLYFVTLKKSNKRKSLGFALKAVEYRNGIAELHTLSMVALWNDDIELAQKHTEILLSKIESDEIEEYESDAIDLIILYLAKGQTNLVSRWFKEYKLEGQLKPLYYALMSLMRDQYPNEILRMGAELKETVDEILQKVVEYKEKYK